MDSKKKHFIELFLKCSKHRKTIEKALKTNTDILRSMYMTISDNVFNEIINNLGVEEYINRIIPIIDKHFTQEELELLVQFYLSPIGKKLCGDNLKTDLNHVLGEIDSDREDAMERT